jgi:iron(III) transport system permease protein
MRGKKYFGMSLGQNRVMLTAKKYTFTGLMLLAATWFVSTALPCVVLVSAVPDIDVVWQTLAGSYDEILYSILLAISCAATALLCSIPYAYLLARRYPFSPVIDFFALVPLAVPASLFSLGLLKGGNFFDLQYLATTSFFCLTGLTAHFLFLAIKIVQAGIEQIDMQGEEAALLAGASTGKILINIIFPQLKSSAAAAFFLLFACSFAELSATLLLVPPGSETVAVKIYNLMHYGADDMVASLCLIILFMIIIFGLLFKICYSWIAHEHRCRTAQF